MSEEFAFINFWNDHHPDNQTRYYNHLAEFVLDDAGIDEAMRGTPLAMTSWIAGDGSPRSIAVPFALLDDDYVYFSATPAQAIVKSIKEDPRISMCWAFGAGAVTLRGQAEIISDDDDLTTIVCDESAKQRYPGDSKMADKLAAKLKSETRVSIKVSKDKFITFNGANLPRD